MVLTYLGILLLSSATLLFEITLTRVFSVAQWYHFAFMVVSLALLGFGASGSFLFLFPGLAKNNLRRLLAICAILFSVTCIGGYFVVNSIPFDSYRLSWEGRQLLYLAVYYLSLAVPFFFTGLALGATLSGMPQRAGKLYGFNMVGSGLGCLLVLISPSMFGVGGTVVLSALLGMAAVFLFCLPRSRLLPALAFAAAAALIVLLAVLPAAFEIKMSPHKSLSQVLLQPQARTLWTKWNSFSRVDVIDSSGIHIAPGLSLNYDKELPAQSGVTVDGDDLSPVSHVEVSGAGFTEYLPTALVYRLSDAPRALIIEPGGGLDVLTALRHGSPEVVAVVSNPLMIEAVSGFTERGGFTHYPGVEEVTEGARSYLRRSDILFDAVQISLTNSFQVVAAGSYSLSENYLYTVEALTDCYGHLAPGGVLSITRWIQVPPSEGIRMIALATAALENADRHQPEQHLVVVRSFQTITLLLKESPFDSKDIEIVKDFCERLGLDLVYYPGIEAADLNRYNVLPREVYHEACTSILSASTRDGFIAGYTYNITPTTDDRPFFFHFFKWNQAPDVLRSLGRTWQPFAGAGYLAVVALLVSAVLASVVFILLPLHIRLKGEGDRIRPVYRGVRWQLFFYFSVLGLGFIFIEIAMMQKFILFLDKPTYAFAIVLFTIFICSGIGSLLAAKLTKVLPQVIVGLGLLALVYPLFLVYYFDMLLGQPLLFRVLATVGALAPLSFLMGIPFPMGIKIIGVLSPDMVPWAWGINGCLSVISSILSLIVAIWLGFTWVLVTAAGTYLVGGGIIYFWIKKINQLPQDRSRLLIS